MKREFRALVRLLERWVATESPRTKAAILRRCQRMEAMNEI